MSIQSAFDDASAKHRRKLEDQQEPHTGPRVTLVDEAASTHARLVTASRKVEEANRILTDAQQEFRTALAAHLKAITGSEVRP